MSIVKRILRLFNQYKKRKLREGKKRVPEKINLSQMNDYERLEERYFQLEQELRLQDKNQAYNDDNPLRFR